MNNWTHNTIPKVGVTIHDPSHRAFQVWDFSHVCSGVHRVVNCYFLLNVMVLLSMMLYWITYYTKLPQLNGIKMLHCFL